jgi:hypothetical protein
VESPQIIAAFVAGIVAPFVQEILLGAKVSGRLAVAASLLVTFIIATAAHWMTGGFAGIEGIPAFNLIDPSAFFAFWWKVWSPVFVLSKLTHGFLTTYVSGGKGEATGPIQTVAEKTQPIIDKVPIIGAS